MSPLAEQWTEQLAGMRPGGPAWLAELRGAGEKAFQAHGLPHRKVEDWKYTSLKLLEARSARLAEENPAAGAGHQAAWPEAVTEIGAPRVRMLNGRAVGDAWSTDAITVVPLHEALSTGRHRWLREMLESLEIDRPALAFSALNTSTLGPGLLVHVPANTDAGTLLLQWAFDDTPPAMLFNSRVVIRLEAGARLNLVEQFESCAGHAHALNLVTQVRVGRGAQLNMVRLQQEKEEAALIARCDCDVAEEGRFESSTFDLGGGLVRHDNRPCLIGPGASARVDGAFVLDGSRHVDHHVFIDHVAGNTRSDQFFRGVLGGGSRGVFNGKARIRQGADGSRVRQSNANLLLSPLAEMDTKPELEIYADEVEASHGATVGQLDEDAVFYLRSRGLDEEQARAMLTAAFCKAVLERVPGGLKSVREALAQRIEHTLNEAL